MTRDEKRSAALLFGEELALGELEFGALDRGSVVEAVRSRPVPSRVGRALQRRSLANGSLSFLQGSVAPMLAARRDVLGDAAPGAPRVLVRVDGFPHRAAADDPAGHGTDAFARFAAILAEHELPFLLSVLPHVPREHEDPAATDWRPLDEDEIATLARLREQGVAFALNGLDHRPRPKHEASELRGRKPADLRERIDRGRAALTQHGLELSAFAAPWDSFDPEQYMTLTQRFEIVCGGPATVATMGWHPAPLWRGDAVYLPSSPPLHGDALTAAAAVTELAERRAALWLPLTLDWAAERDDPDAVAELCRALRGHARPWPEFLAAVRASAVLAS